MTLYLRRFIFVIARFIRAIHTLIEALDPANKSQDDNLISSCSSCPSWLKKTDDKNYG
jgi:hypothetical protein